MAKSYLNKDGVLYLWQKIKTLLSGKVDKIEGKGLSTNDYTTTEKQKLNSIQEGATQTIIETSFIKGSMNAVASEVIRASLENKVDKVTGKGLSSNDYTNEEKEKVNGIKRIKGFGAIDVRDDIDSQTIQVRAYYGLTVAEMETDNPYLTVNLAENSGLSKNGYVPDKGAGAYEGLKIECGEFLEVSADNKLNIKKSTLLSDYSTSQEVDSKIKTALTSAMTYKGTVETYDDLPTNELKIGDLWNVSDTGKNYVWSGEEWDEQGGTIDLSNYLQETDIVAITNEEIDTIIAS